MEAAATDCSRGPVGGATTIVLGSDDHSKMFSQRQAEREVPAETPDAAVRFPQAPGGSASICLGGCTPDVVAKRGPVGGSDSVDFGAEETSSVPVPRGPIGGVATVVLGCDNMKDAFDTRHEQRHTAVPTPDAVPRFPQAPGGAATFTLGGDDGVAEGVAIRGPVGGASTLMLGCDDSKQMFDQHQEQRGIDIETPEAACRFQQAPGGNTTICLANGIPEAVPTRGPVGGGTTIILGSDDTMTTFSRDRKQLDALVDAPHAAPRFQQAPGGTASIDLGSEGIIETILQRGPVGGAATIALGTDDAAETFIDHKYGEFETPSAAPRFPQAPGGTSSINLHEELHARVCLPVSRGAVGGETTIILGADNSADAFNDTSGRRVVETPDAAPRFQQAPGGSASICLGGEDPALLTDMAMAQSQAIARRAVAGPETTISMGGSTDAFREYHQQRGALIETPNAPQRFQQAPGGSSSICLSEEVEGAGVHSTVTSRGPVGGPSSMVLGGDDHREVFLHHNSHRALDIETPDAAPRFPQAPGGSATIQFGNERGLIDEVFATPIKGPVGGAATIVLGDGDYAEALADHEKQRALSIATPNAAPRFPQAPGGHATLQLGSKNNSSDAIAVTPVRGPVGGSSTIILGGDDPSEAFTHDEVCHETPEAPNRFPQAPGGTATLVLGGAGAAEQKAHDQLRQAPGGSATIVLGGDPNDPHDTFCGATSSNKFANGANQNSGNFVTDRSTTRLLHAPGGSSSLCLGDDSTPLRKPASQTSKGPDPQAIAIQAAPTPSRLRRSPGGEATICFGGDAEDALNTHGVSSNRFADGANQNCGNTITDRSTTRLHHAPGGASTLILGNDDSDSSSRWMNKVAEAGPIEDRPSTRQDHAAGGPARGSKATAKVESPASMLDGTSSASTSSNKFANGSNQNCGNSITDRPTTRVHQAPGGASTISFGGD